MEQITKHARMAANDPEFRGLTLEELRYRRAYTLARIEIEKERLTRDTAGLWNPQIGSWNLSGLLTTAGGMSRYIEYGLIAWRVGKSLMSIVRRFRRR